MQVYRIWARVKLSMKMPVHDRERYCQLSQVKAVHKYPKTVYDGDILYLKSGIPYLKSKNFQQLSVQGWWEDIFWGFEELCAGRFEAHMIGGEHDDVLKNKKSHQIIREKMFKINDS